ncbi:hypothetical protein OOJ91_13970 [Micromonospora lupini]|uniref:hypothetical protein n=1 Tax=Micromonospora lupini TaxID=285679 RepID=UPI002254FF54|nr:hypothetical protein [Micromonospora lupini]MCX5066955.1 hypothetical protein [Micromonospora lupini]
MSRKTTAEAQKRVDRVVELTRTMLADGHHPDDLVDVLVTEFSDLPSDRVMAMAAAAMVRLAQQSGGA